MRSGTTGIRLWLVALAGVLLIAGANFSALVPARRAVIHIRALAASARHGDIKAAPARLGKEARGAEKKDHRAKRSIPAFARIRRQKDRPRARKRCGRSDPLKSSRKDRRGPGRPTALPVPRRCLSRGLIDEPHHDYPAWDIAVPRGTLVRAVRGGIVVDRTRRGACGKGVIVRGVDGYEYTYCHGSKVLREPGKRVDTGEVLMRSGTTGRSTGPHLHLQVEGPKGSLVCPQKLVRAGYAGKAIPTWETRTRGCVGR